MQDITFLPRDDWGFPIIQIKHIRIYSIAKIFVKMQHFSYLIFLIFLNLE